jgi:hypothetical protein
MCVCGEISTDKIFNPLMALLGGGEKHKVGAYWRKATWGISLGAVSCPGPFLQFHVLLPDCYELKSSAPYTILLCWTKTSDIMS